MEADAWAGPTLGVALTVGVYAGALWVQRRVAWLHPLVLTTAVLIGLILVARVPLESYRAGGDVLTFFLGPATVALAVPLYRRLREIRTQLPAVLGSVAIGGTVAAATSWAIVRALGGAYDVQLAMLSRSVTTPISIGIATELHAAPQLAATFTVLSGLLGAVIGPAFLRLIGIRADLALGLGIGTAAHGIGTSSVIRHSEAQGAAAGLAMALNGVFTSLLMIPVYGWVAVTK
jgi:predicted murein hydrolase (TIGR00659 family)